MSGMVIKKFGFEELKRKLQEQRAKDEADDQKIKRLLSYIGEELCNHARREGDYANQTGNLRSSVGYRIYKDGEPVTEGGFKNVGEGKGIEVAKLALDKYRDENDIPKNGWTLTIVAGEHYATYVEAKGFNVLHLTNIEMEKEIEQLKKDLRL